jgi:hypothetical protein
MDANELRNRAKQWREIAAHQEHAAAGAMLEAARWFDAEADRREREPRRLDAKRLRNQAKRWRDVAASQKPGAADAMIEAACDLEGKAGQLEREQRQARQQPRQGHLPPKR